MSASNPFGTDEVNDDTNPFGKEDTKRPADAVDAHAKNDTNDTNDIDPSDDLARFGIGSITGGATPTKVPNQAWVKDWDDASRVIHGSEVCGSKVYEKLSITVCSPEIVSSMMSKHVVYTVKTEVLNRSVRRRYNDFAWLRERLAARYEGMCVPSVPGTTAFSSKSSMGKKTDVESDFVRNRMAQLHFFMQLLCDIPFLRTDQDLTYFLTIDDEKEFKTIMDSSPTVINSVGGAATPEKNNEGLKLWLLLVDKTELNSVEADKAIVDFKHQLDVLKSSLNLVDIECRATGKKVVLGCKGMNSLSEVVNTWVGQELDLVDPTRTECVNTYCSDVTAAMEALQSCQAHWAQNIALIPKIIARVIMSNVQFQLQQVAGLRIFLSSREQLVKELERSQKERVKALDDKRRATSPSNKRQSGLFTKGIDELESSLVKKTEQQNNFQAIVDRLTKALVFCEMDRFNRERLASIRSLLASLATIHTHLSSSTSAKWSETAAALGLTLQEFEEFAGTLSSKMDDDVFGD